MTQPVTVDYTVPSSPILSLSETGPKVVLAHREQGLPLESKGRDHCRARQL
ncbi:hypothetical protein NQZ68_037050 [Dissostichus eleginoides]|nr:hypothetical protein NQZ68_037050 [Dissostichus eleginoides]